MKKTIKISMIIATAILFVACASGNAVEKAAVRASSSQVDSSVMAAIDAAKAAVKKAATVDGVWRDTGKFIKKAEKLAKQGKNAEAMKLANKAKLQGELGYQQAISQAHAGPRF